MLLPSDYIELRFLFLRLDALDVLARFHNNT